MNITDIVNNIQARHSRLRLDVYQWAPGMQYLQIRMPINHHPFGNNVPEQVSDNIFEYIEEHAITNGQANLRKGYARDLASVIRIIEGWHLDRKQVKVIVDGNYYFPTNSNRPNIHVPIPDPGEALF